MFDTRRGHSSPSGPLWWFPTFSSMIFPLKSPLLQDEHHKKHHHFSRFLVIFSIYLPLIHGFRSGFPASHGWHQDQDLPDRDSWGVPPAAMRDLMWRSDNRRWVCCKTPPCGRQSMGNPWEFPWEFPGFFFWDVLILTGWCFFWDSIHQNGSFMGFNGIEPTRNGDLVGGDWNMNGLFFHILGISWSQLTHIFQRGLKPPTSVDFNISVRT